ncbi:ABC transporter permease [Paenibacillus sp. JX-17]|uniref:ABC transporter permease n=1 Tax=Paenibacillus lacisoli TaxID=3064525 RepID=A0ABT9CEB5_9BACL|nr:ABC transporter permease [Paenibacillus sp. JX-17]MDO7906969.1 ABC transporter permease [Paenibacillus sp. JX-17]
MFALISKELRLIRKDRRSFIFLLFMPIAFILIFGSINNQEANTSAITLQVVDQDNSEASRAFVSRLSGIITVDASPAGELNQQLDRLKQGQMTSMLVIPAQFEQKLKNGAAADITLYKDPASQTAIAPIQAILQGMSDQYREQKIKTSLTSLGASAQAAQQALVSPIAIKPVNMSSEQLSAIDQIVPGMTVMFVFFIMITMTRRFFEEKKTGLFTRIRSTRITPVQYLIGMWVPFILTVMAQCSVLFAFGHFMYDLHLGNYPALIVIVIALSIAGTGIGLGLSFVVPGEGAAMVITQLISMGGAILGGLWFPTYLLPEFVQHISRFMPQYWAQHSLINIIAHHAHISDVLLPAGVLLLFGLVGLGVALLRLPSFLRTAVN